MCVCVRTHIYLRYVCNWDTFRSCRESPLTGSKTKQSRIQKLLALEMDFRRRICLTRVSRLDQVRNDTIRDHGSSEVVSCCAPVTGQQVKAEEVVVMGSGGQEPNEVVFGFYIFYV